MVKKILPIAAILILAILSFGYWHVTTHGWLSVSLYRIDDNVSTFKTIKNANVVLMNADEDVLATGKSDNRHGVVYLSHPELGYCVEDVANKPITKESRKKWAICHQKQVEWVTEWASQVKLVDINFNDCTLNKVPVTVFKSQDAWWLWWVPLPHVGGKPTSYYDISLHIDTDNCKAKSR